MVYGWYVRLLRLVFNNENTAGTLLLLLKQIWFLNVLCFGPAPPPDAPPTARNAVT